MAVKIAATARIIGINAETTDPNTSAKMMRAIAIPIVSPVTRSLSANSLKVCSMEALPTI